MVGREREWSYIRVSIYVLPRTNAINPFMHLEGKRLKLKPHLNLSKFKYAKSPLKKRKQFI
jgi:hypothetical protein